MLDNFGSGIPLPIRRAFLANHAYSVWMQSAVPPARARSTAHCQIEPSLVIQAGGGRHL